MKKHLFILVIIIFILTHSGNSSDWRKIDKIYGGLAKELIIKNDIIIALSFNKGLYISDKKNIGWKQICDTNLQKNITSICSDSRNNVYAYVHNEGLFINQAEDNQWERLPKVNLNIHTLESIDTAIYMSTTEGNIFISLDKCKSWDSVETDFPYLLNYPIGDGRNLYAKATDRSGTGGIVKSTDNGTTWKFTDTNSINHKSFMQTCIDKYSNLYSYGYSGLFRLNNNGYNWDNLSKSFFDNRIGAISFLGDSTIFVATLINNYVSTDLGNSWAIIPAGLSENTNVLISLSDSTILAGNNSGLFLTENTGRSWKEASTGYNNVNPFFISKFDKDRIFALDNNSLFIGDYKKDDWIVAARPARSSEVGVSEGRICFNIGKGTIVYSEDTLKSFSQYGTALTYGARNFRFSKNGEIFAIGSTGIIVTRNKSTTWDFYSRSLEGKEVLSFELDKSENIYAIISDTTGNKLFKANKGDTAFHLVQSCSTLNNLNKVALSSDNFIYLLDTSEGIYKFSDHLDKPTLVYKEKEIQELLLDIEDNPICMTSSAVYCSYSGGTIWKEIDALPSKRLFDLEVNANNDIFITTDIGLIYMTKPTGIDDKVEVTHNTFANPLPCKDFIMLNLPDEEIKEIHIVITNLAGQVTMEATTNDSSINVGDLTNGIYLCTIQYESKGKQVVKTMKMIIEK
jgi:photosystem II stability/assembly factor-like uncharacterized protein